LFATVHVAAKPNGNEEIPRHACEKSPDHGRFRAEGAGA
jgi:hypothetical protein